MRKIWNLRQHLLIGVAVGIVMPFFFALCLFGTSLQKFVAAPEPTAGYWSGAPTPVPTRPPGPIRTWTGDAFSAGGGVVFIAWSVLGALAGAALALRRWGEELNPLPYALLGALVGSVGFIVVSLFGLLK